MSEATSIEELFGIYRAVLFSHCIAPDDEREDRRAFFCGFNACLQLINAISGDASLTDDFVNTEFEGLLAEFERFAANHDYDKSTNH